MKKMKKIKKKEPATDYGKDWTNTVFDNRIVNPRRDVYFAFAQYGPIDVMRLRNLLPHVQKPEQYTKGLIDDGLIRKNEKSPLYLEIVPGSTYREREGPTIDELYVAITEPRDVLEQEVLATVTRIPALLFAIQTITALDQTLMAEDRVLTTSFRILVKKSSDIVLTAYLAQWQAIQETDPENTLKALIDHTPRYVVSDDRYIEMLIERMNTWSLLESYKDIDAEIKNEIDRNETELGIGIDESDQNRRKRLTGM